jgi:hypothetical protein
LGRSIGSWPVSKLVGDPPSPWGVVISLSFLFYFYLPFALGKGGVLAICSGFFFFDLPFASGKCVLAFCSEVFFFFSAYPFASGKRVLAI